jgi:hypothetical protein
LTQQLSRHHLSLHLPAFSLSQHQPLPTSTFLLSLYLSLSLLLSLRFLVSLSPRLRLLLHLLPRTMAIHPDHPGLVAEVVVNGQALREYDDDGQPQLRTVTKYVEAVSDARFSVRYTIPKGLTGVCGVRSNLMIDGRNARSQTTPHHRIEECKVTEHLKSLITYHGGASYSQDFRFSQLHIGKLEEIKWHGYASTCSYIT